MLVRALPAMMSSREKGDRWSMLLRARYSLKDRPCMCRIRARRERSALPCKMSRTEEPVKTAKLQKIPQRRDEKGEKKV